MKQEEGRFLSVMYLVSLVLLAGFAIYGLKNTGAVSVSAPIPRPTIILDAGHGGTDGGATAPDGTRECDVNLLIVKKLDCVFALLGEETVLTRSMDTDLADSTAKSISQKKVSDIRNRTALVNEVPGGVLLSIHQNTYSESKYHGAQAFYGKEAGSQQMAEAIQSAIASEVDTGNLRKAKAIPPDVYLLKHITAPGVLVECGFLTNPEERTNLNAPDYQKRLALAIATALYNYYGEKEPEV